MSTGSVASSIQEYIGDDGILYDRWPSYDAYDAVHDLQQSFIEPPPPSSLMDKPLWEGVHGYQLIIQSLQSNMEINSSVSFQFKFIKCLNKFVGLHGLHVYVIDRESLSLHW